MESARAEPDIDQSMLWDGSKFEKRVISFWFDSKHATTMLGASFCRLVVCSVLASAVLGLDFDFEKHDKEIIGALLRSPGRIIPNQISHLNRFVDLILIAASVQGI